jgi:allantoin racemase
LKPILLINPNTSHDTTAMMVEIARSCVPDGLAVTGATATRGPPMIVTAEALAAAADEVVEIGTREASQASGIIVSAFGDPGLETLRRNISIPAVGICEASMIEAAEGGRRFGVATVTPQLAIPIEQRARDLNLHHLYSGIRVTPGDPVTLAADSRLLEQALAKAVAQCLEYDLAEAVIIGGGPLGQAAISLASSFKKPVIAPIPSAVRRLLAMIRSQTGSPTAAGSRQLS